MTLLKTTDQAFELAAELMAAGALPVNSEADALHVALAASNGVSFLLTWNCRHLANAMMRPTIEAVCKKQGVLAPIICTPDVLLEEKP